MGLGKDNEHACSHTNPTCSTCMFTHKSYMFHMYVFTHKSYMFHMYVYTQILHAPHVYLHTNPTCSTCMFTYTSYMLHKNIVPTLDSTVQKSKPTVTNQLLLDISQPLNIWTDSAVHWSLDDSLLDRLKRSRVSVCTASYKNVSLRKGQSQHCRFSNGQTFYMISTNSLL